MKNCVAVRTDTKLKEGLLSRSGEEAFGILFRTIPGAADTDIIFGKDD